MTPVESSPLLFGVAFQAHAQAHYALIQVLLGGGGVKIGQDVRTQLRGVSPDSTNKNKGRVGVKKPEIFAYVLYGWPLMAMPL